MTREDLLNIARTTLSSKLLSHEKYHFAELAVNAVLRLRGSGNLDYIQVCPCLYMYLCNKDFASHA
jgi:T-complex protein 1 subunit beta